jgi:hypothetical protein
MAARANSQLLTQADGGQEALEQRGIITEGAGLQARRGEAYKLLPLQARR